MMTYINYITSCDVSVKMTDCIDNKRDIFFYKNCTDNQPVSQSLLNQKCGDLKCPEGTYITYSLEEKKQICKKCSANTFSTGSIFRICGTMREWYPHKLDGFKNLCFIGNYEDKNTTCQPWTINKYHSRLVAGGTNLTDVWYTTVLTKTVKLNFDGFVNYD